MADIRDTLRSRFDQLCCEYIARHNINNSELARRMTVKLAGRMTISPQKLDKYRRLQVQIRFPEAEAFADFFGVSIAWLCGESDVRERLSPDMQRAILQLMEASSKDNST